jgi:hypothetical protein
MAEIPVVGRLAAAQNRQPFGLLQERHAQHLEAGATRHATESVAISFGLIRIHFQNCKRSECERMQGRRQVPSRTESRSKHLAVTLGHDLRDRWQAVPDRGCFHPGVNKNGESVTWDKIPTTAPHTVSNRVVLAACVIV